MKAFKHVNNTDRRQFLTYSLISEQRIQTSRSHVIGFYSFIYWETMELRFLFLKCYLMDASPEAALLAVERS